MPRIRKTRRNQQAGRLQRTAAQPKPADPTEKKDRDGIAGSEAMDAADQAEQVGARWRRLTGRPEARQIFDFPGLRDKSRDTGPIEAQRDGGTAADKIAREARGDLVAEKEREGLRPDIDREPDTDEPLRHRPRPALHEERELKRLPNKLKPAGR